MNWYELDYYSVMRSNQPWHVLLVIDSGRDEIILGTVKIDTNKTVYKHEAIHPYTEIGVERLLRDINTIWTESTYGGDINATILRLDLELALQSECLSPRQRQAIWLYYFCQLTERECGNVLRIHHENVRRRIKTAISNITEHMIGFNIVSSQRVDDKFKTERSRGDWLYIYNNSVLFNVTKWWDLGVAMDWAILDINAIIGMPKPAWKQIRRPKNYPKVTEYPILTERQMRRRNREREILIPVIY